MFLFEDICVVLNVWGWVLVDIDWYIEWLYDGLLFGVIMVWVMFYCYVIDVNCGFDDVSLYFGQNIMGFVLLIDFDGQLIWDVVLIEVDIVDCKVWFYVFYYVVLVVEIVWVCVWYGVVIFYDCYLICSYILFLFDGILFDFNIGIDSGCFCVLVIEVVM